MTDFRDNGQFAEVKSLLPRSGAIIGKCLSSVIRLAIWLVTLWWAAGIALHLAVRDRLPLLSTVFYASPAAVCAALAVAACGGWALRRRWRWALVMLVAAAASAAWWGEASFYDRAGQPRSGDVTLVFWNTARGAGGWPQVFEQLRGQDAPIIAMVEANATEPGGLARWRAAFPEYHSTDLAGGILILSRGPILEVQYGDLGFAGLYKRVRLELDGRRLQIVVVDLDADPLGSRRDSLARLARRAANWSGEPLIVVGDFNTPADSAHFDPLRRELTHAFESAGNGYAPTWPLPLPVLQLDHIWLGPGVKAVSCDAGWAACSDHRSLRAVLRFSP